MKILALEFSSPQRSVALVEANPPANPATLSEIVEVEGRITNALPLVEQSLREAGVEREQIDCLAIGIGPGSYAGIRSAIALAQGWQLAREIKLRRLAASNVSPNRPGCWDCADERILSSMRNGTSFTSRLTKLPRRACKTSRPWLSQRWRRSRLVRLGANQSPDRK